MGHTPESVYIRRSHVSWYWAECGLCGTKSNRTTVFADHVGWRCPHHEPHLTVVPDLPVTVLTSEVAA